MTKNKGDIGYLNNVKHREWVKCAIQWGLVIGLLVVGYITTETKLNWLTFVAILGCLPASKTLVGVLVKLPIKPMEESKINEIETVSTLLTTSYDVILTSKDKIMPIHCVVIAGTTVYGYTTNAQVGPNECANYMKAFLSQNECGNVNVKIFHDYKPFISRIEGLNNMASVDKRDTKDIEEKIKYTLKLYSM